MGKCVIFCAGAFSAPAEALTEEDYIIAADGGLRHTQALGLTPDAILGDFDSLGYIPEGARVFPVEKDDTDAILAIRHGLERGFREFILYGSLDGPRLDHTLANIQALRFLADRGARGRLVGLNQTVLLLPRGTLEFPAAMQGDISVFALEEAEDVTILGLQYELRQGRLSPGYPLGCSNHFVGRPARITTRSPLLILFTNQPLPR